MDYYYAYLYIISRSKHNETALIASINQIRSLTGGKKNKTKKNRVKRQYTRRKKQNKK
jgi:hypothetical protein